MLTLKSLRRSVPVIALTVAASLAAGVLSTAQPVEAQGPGFYNFDFTLYPVFSESNGSSLSCGELVPTMYRRVTGDSETIDDGWRLEITQGFFDLLTGETLWVLATINDAGGITVSPDGAEAGVVVAQPMGQNQMICDGTGAPTFQSYRVTYSVRRNFTFAGNTWRAYGDSWLKVRSDESIDNNLRVNEDQQDCTKRAQAACGEPWLDIHANQGTSVIVQVPFRDN